MLGICTDISVNDSLVTVFIGIMSDRLWANSSQFNIGFCYKLISKAALKVGKAVHKNCSFRYFLDGYFLYALPSAESSFFRNDEQENIRTLSWYNKLHDNLRVQGWKISFSLISSPNKNRFVICAKRFVSFRGIGKGKNSRGFSESPTKFKLKEISRKIKLEKILLF